MNIVLCHLLAFLCAVTLHEIGHLLCAVILKVKLQSYAVGIYGIRLKFNFMSCSRLKQLAVCISGGAAGIISAVICFFCCSNINNLTAEFVLSSLALSAVNMLPISGLDGGAILNCILESVFLPDISYRICRLTSAFISVVMWLLAVRVQMRVGCNLSFLLISMYFLSMSIADLG